MIYSTIGFLILVVALVHYFSKLKQNQTPKNPILLKSAMLVGSILSIWSLVTLRYQLDLNTILVLLFTINTLSTSAIFAYFLATKATPIGDIKIKVGDTFIPFKTNEFDSESLIGKRTLLKFYRGSWCPYCSAELAMFEALKPKLNEYGVQIIALSNDSAEEQKLHLERDNISHTLVSDPDLAIIKQYGVEHHKGLGATAADTISICGIAMPLPWKMRFKAMAIPTSILIDKNGKIVWIDQSDDYRLRASEEAIMGAVASHFNKADAPE